MQDAPKFPYYGTEHFGFTVDNVDAACDELRAKGADIAIGPLNRDASLRLAFIRGPEDIMIELVQSKQDILIRRLSPPPRASGAVTFMVCP
jgi:catechol 2,3-dioxygenase-like lactoylglutathione lyase family enzyme